MIRRIGLGTLALAVVGLALGLFALPPAGAQMKVPEDFAFEGAKDSPGPVTFSHAAHKEKVAKCTGCHTKIFKMKKGKTGPLTMEKMKAGEQCGACHDGKTDVGGVVAFGVSEEANCEKCHAK